MRLIRGGSLNCLLMSADTNKGTLGKMMRSGRQSQCGFTLTEVVISCAIAALVLLGTGAALVHAQRNWEQSYERVNGDAASDVYTAARAFESVVRQSSVAMRPPALSNSGDFIELYLYENLLSNLIDCYARMYVENKQFVIVYGRLNDKSYESVVEGSTGYIQTASSTQDAYRVASSPLAGSTAQSPTGDNATISSEEAMDYFGEGAFAELFSQTAADSTTGLTSKGASRYGKLHKLVLARNVKAVSFCVNGATVRMLLSVENGGETRTIMCSALRHSG